MKILFVGDIVGEPGRETIKKIIPEIVTESGAEFVIANAENAAGGKGITQKVVEEIFQSGVNVITLGNHAWARKEIEDIINDIKILRPANYPPGVPGQGWNIYQVCKEHKIAVMNLMGRVYMPILDCPFRTADIIIEKITPVTRNIIIDFHAEITSEKQAMGWYVDGKVSAIIGTHTHIQTNDERILPNGTAYITDCGMVGPQDGVIGMDREIILKKYLTGMPYKFTVAKGSIIFNACIIDIDTETGHARKIETLRKTVK